MPDMDWTGKLCCAMDRGVSADELANDPDHVAVRECLGEVAAVSVRSAMNACRLLGLLCKWAEDTSERLAKVLNTVHTVGRLIKSGGEVGAESFDMVCIERLKEALQDLSPSVREADGQGTAGATGDEVWVEAAKKWPGRLRLGQDEARQFNDSLSAWPKIRDRISGFLYGANREYLDTANGAPALQKKLGDDVQPLLVLLRIVRTHVPRRSYEILASLERAISDGCAAEDTAREKFAAIASLAEKEEYETLWSDREVGQAG